MNETTRYLLASAGIEATEEEIAAIDASGHPYEVCSVLAHYAHETQAERAKHAMDAMRRSLDENWRQHER